MKSLSTHINESFEINEEKIDESKNITFEITDQPELKPEKVLDDVIGNGKWSFGEKNSDKRIPVTVPDGLTDSQKKSITFRLVPYKL